MEADVPQSKYLTNPSHQIKTICSPIYKMAINTKDPNRCNKIDFLQVKNTQVATSIKVQTYHSMILCSVHEYQTNIYLIATRGAMVIGVGLGNLRIRNKR